MAWLIPLFVLILAIFFWRLSFRTDDRVVAWCRFILAALLVGVAATVSVGIAFA